MALINNDDYVSWFSHLFGSHTYEWIFAVSFVAASSLFLVGYVIARLGGLEYPQPAVYVGLFAVFGMTAALGIADDTYPEVWNDVRGTFAVDDETYLEVVRPKLDRMHDEQRIAVYAATLATPYFFAMVVSYLPVRVPFREQIIIVVFGETPTYETGVAAVVLVCLFGAVSAVLIATVLNGFVQHLALVREVSELPFEDVYASAAGLAPVASYSIASATAWFAGISLVVLWMQTAIAGTLGTTFIVLLVVTGITFFSAPQLMLHDALVEAKREELNGIRREYQELLDRTRTDGFSSEAVSLELELTDRRLENARSIRTWVFDLSSAGKLVAASIIPWLELVQEFESVLAIV